MPTPEEEQQQALIQALFANNPEMAAARQAEQQRVAEAAGQGLNRDGSAMSQAQQMEGIFSGWAGASPLQQQQAQQAEDARVKDAASQGYNRDGSLTPEAAAAQATDARFGSDMSWLDPKFQQQAELLGQSAGSQVKGDPAAIAAQTGLLGTAQQFASQNLAFQDPSQQAGLAAQWAQIQGGQGAPQFLGNAQQQSIMQGLLGIKAPQFSGDADQRAVLNQALGLSTNTGPGSLAFDTSGRQGEQYGNLQDIIKGGGATAIEMADRQRARADSESWLRGQREADMANYAERGLTGSGMELLNLSSDRQAAAGRNSMADLDMAKALEERRLGAINSAAGLATNMRGQTVDEQSLLNNRSISGLSAASSTANSMRDANIREQLGLNEALQSQQTNAAGIASTMRGQDMSEKSYLDQRTINALLQQTDLATKMRDQQANESIANQNAKQAGLSSGTSLANSMRTSSAQENQYAADSADLFSRLNNQTINAANQANTQFLQNAYTNTQNNRTQVGMNELNQKVAAAGGQQARDNAETAAGFDQARSLGITDAATWNAMSQELRDKILGVVQGTQDKTAAAQAAANAAKGQIATGGVGTAGTIIGAAIGGAGAGSAAGGATAAEGAATGAQVGAQALTKTGETEEEKRRRAMLTGSGY